MASETDIEEQIRRVIKQGLDEQDTDVIREAFADEVELMGKSSTVPVDFITNGLLDYYEALPDLHHEIHDILVDDQTAVVHYTNIGTFEEPLTMEVGPIAGHHIDPTGEEVEYSGVYLARFDDGKVVAWINHSEQLSAFQQLGIVPDFDEFFE